MFASQFITGLYVHEDILSSPSIDTKLTKSVLFEQKCLNLFPNPKPLHISLEFSAQTRTSSSLYGAS